MAASIMSFSPSGNFFAFCGPEGNLKIWETATNRLKQEYVPSSHLSAACTCLKWRPERKLPEYSGGSKKKKRLKNASGGKKQEDLIILGTSSGSLLVYSVLRGDLQASWASGHEEKVNDVSWSKHANILYSCSDDSKIIEWDSVSGTKKQTLSHVDSTSVFAICLCKNDSMLLSASRSIKLWDLKKKVIVQKFTGHATEVYRLMSVPCNDTSDASGFYFLSSARNDRLIHVWHSPSSSNMKVTHNALASLQLSDSALSLDITQQQPDDGANLFTAVTTAGNLMMFRQVLNGKCKKPLQPRVNVHIATSNAQQPQKILILSAAVHGDKVLIVYGTPLKPRFEKISYDGLNKDNCLLRDDPTIQIKDATEVSKVRTPLISEDVKILTPGHMVPSLPSTSKGSKAGKKRQRMTSIDLTVEDRLDFMYVNEKQNPQSSTLQTASTAILLAQGLQSQDGKILNHVLQLSSPAVVQNTVKKLPIPLIIPLVGELSKRMQGHGQCGQNIIQWVKCLLMTHSSYLMTFPELVQNLSTLYQMMDSRVSMFGRMSRLEGKLDLLVSQVSKQSEVVESNDQAMFTLQDESSDEEDILPVNDDSDKNWMDEDESEDELEMEAEASGAQNGDDEYDEEDEEDENEDEVDGEEEDDDDDDVMEVIELDGDDDEED